MAQIVSQGKARKRGGICIRVPDRGVQAVELRGRQTAPFRHQQSRLGLCLLAPPFLLAHCCPEQEGLGPCHRPQPKKSTRATQATRKFVPHGKGSGLRADPSRPSQWSVATQEATTATVAVVLRCEIPTHPVRECVCLCLCLCV